MPYILKAEQLETQVNKVTVLTDDVTNEQYPSAKAVKDAIANIESDITIDQEYTAESENPQSGKAVAEAVKNKVDKVDGKQLSTNDFSNEDKLKLDNIQENATNVGKRTLEGGEIFNDYENNLAGSKAFTVTGIEFSVTDGSGGGAYNLENNSGKTLTELGLSVGDTFSVHLAQGDNNSLQCDNCSEITAIQDDINQVVVSKLFNNTHFDASKFKTWDSYLDGDGNDTEVNTFRIPKKPNVGTRSIGVWTSAKNRGTQALSKGASAEGSGTVAAGSWSHAEGRNTYAAYASHAEGVGTKALGQGVHTEGQNTTATYWASHAEGTATQALNNSAHSEGDSTKALGTASHSEGKLTEASGNYSHSEGESCKATGKSSHAEGTSTQAKGTDSHTEGYLSIAEGAGCHAEGYNTKAQNSYSHAEGQDTVAMGWASHAAGTGTVAVNSSHTTVGNYNDWKKYEKWTADKSIIPYFTVGNGTSDTDRKNAFEVFADGHAELQTVGATDNSVATREFVLANSGNVDTSNLQEKFANVTTAGQGNGLTELVVNNSFGITTTGSNDTSWFLTTNDGLQLSANGTDKTIGIYYQGDPTRFTGIATPTEATDAANKAYVDSKCKNNLAFQEVHVNNTNDITIIPTNGTPNKLNMYLWLFSEDESIANLNITSFPGDNDLATHHISMNVPNNNAFVNIEYINKNANNFIKYVTNSESSETKSGITHMPMADSLKSLTFSFSHSVSGLIYVEETYY